MTSQGSLIFITIAILGGSGKEGKGLAYRWAKAGYRVVIGSRSEDRATTTAMEILDKVNGKAFIEGTNNVRAVQAADVVVLAVPYAAHISLLNLIKPYLLDKLIIDVTVPLVPPKITQVQMPPAGSIGLEDRQILGPDARITTAFHNISHENLMNDEAIECDVLVTGVNKETRQETLNLVNAIGVRGWDAGPLENSVVAEGLTSILIHINKQHNSRRAGIKITGIAAE